MYTEVIGKRLTKFSKISTVCQNSYVIHVSDKNC